MERFRKWLKIFDFLFQRRFGEKLSREIRVAWPRGTKVFRRFQGSVLPGKEEVRVEKRRRCVGSQTTKLPILSDVDVEQRRERRQGRKFQQGWSLIRGIDADGSAQTSTRLCGRKIFLPLIKFQYFFLYFFYFY